MEFFMTRGSLFHKVGPAWWMIVNVTWLSMQVTDLYIWSSENNVGKSFMKNITFNLKKKINKMSAI